jgi:outer membrane lipoprotein-sorting protein
MDVWVDRQTDMPRRIDTQTEESTRRTELSNIQVNPGLNESDLELPKVGDDWSRQDEPFTE